MVGVGRVTTLHTPDTVYSQSASLASLGAAASRLGSRPQRRRLVAALSSSSGPVLCLVPVVGVQV